jgi:carbon-monoxide dehydrogenase large subunit
VYCGGATLLAARDVRDKALELAADMLEANAVDLEISDGWISVRGDAAVGVSFADVARRANHEPHLLPEGAEAGLESTRRYEAPDPGTFSSTMHAAHVEVDPDTGEVTILRYAVVEDCGTIINPMIVEGQVHGGIVQGVGQALLENAVYDKETGQLISGSYMDYTMPRADDFCHFNVQLAKGTPCTHNPLGVKGCGEVGAIGSPPAVINAVIDALKSYGVTDITMPATPQRVWQAIHGASRQAAE